MSPVRLNGSTSGNVSIDAPAVAGNNTLILPGGNGTSGQVLTTNGSGALSWMPQNILQVVNSNTATGTTTTSSAYVDTNSTLTITPKASSSKILIFASQNAYTNRNGVSQTFGDIYLRLVRGATELCAVRQGINFGTTTWTDMIHAASSLIWLDSPATTSPTIYKIMVKTTGGCSVTTPFEGYMQITAVEVAS